MSKVTLSTPAELTPLQKAFLAIRRLQDKIDGLEQAAQEPIAIVGLGCRLPGAETPAAFWDLLRDGRDLITEIPKDRFDLSSVYDPEPGRSGKTYSRHGSFLSGIDRFDAAFFGITAREAEAMDPQQRLTLEVAWEALEDAGIIPADMAGSRTGVFVGVTSLDYGLLQLEQVDRGQGNPYFNTGTPLNACAGRVSYVLGLQGPCMAVDTACSSSLSAIHLACTSLRTGDCDAALAGGVNVILVPQLFVTLSAAGMLSPDGRCKTFDATANGYVRGEGCGLVVLKRLSDAQKAGDTILALIRGTLVNQDGASSGFTVPNGPAQQKLIQATLAKSALAPEDIDYVEAHGTGTSIGDLIETQTLGAVLGQARPPGDPLLVGSVKSNIGHLESAAGVAGLIKLVQALRHELLPASLHVAQPNPSVAWDSLNVRPVLSPTPWPRREKPRRAGLSSFGASGCNAHLILEEAPAAQAPLAPDNDRPVHVLTLTAKSETALRDLAGRYATWLSTTPPIELADACHSANTGRSRFKVRAAIVASDIGQAAERLTAVQQGQKSIGTVTKPPRCAFLFSGQGALHAGAGRALYDGHDGFRQAMQACEAVLVPLLDRPLLSALYGDDADELLGQAIYAQPALFALQYALAGLWRSWGLRPHAVMGHSLGEYAAACDAGMMGLEDGLRLVLARARLMQDLPDWGGMVAVIGDPALVEQATIAEGGKVSIAAFNGPQETVVAGSKAALASIIDRLERVGLATTPLRVTHGFHSPVMDPILDDLTHVAANIAFQPPRVSFVSNLTGEMLPDGSTLDGSYWRHQCREPVRFAQGLTRLLDDDIDLFIELGAHPVLTQFGRRRVPGAVWLPSLAHHRDCWSQMADSVADAFTAGIDIDWASFDQGVARARLPLPTYAFQRKSYWFAAKETTMDTISSSSVPARDSRQIQHAAVFEQVRTLVAGMLRITPAEVNTSASFLELGADSLVLVESIRLIQDVFGVKLEIRQFFEDLPTIAALADYLADRSTVGLPSAIPAPAPSLSQTAPAPVQST
ncbi:MAG: acyltransferase domain-containing protein, partial [Niveispirillum sp.]|nr:acyltransferase domain-containing protein [Niveispirillum sp.]